MLSINDLKIGTLFVFSDDPYEVLEANHLKIGRGGAILQTRIRNLRTNNILERNFKPSDRLEEANVEKKTLKFIYTHRGNFVFVDQTNKRFNLSEAIIGDKTKFLKENLEVEAIYFNNELLNIVLPIKIDFRVVEAPPSIKGDTAQGGTKIVTIETEAQIKTPLFIKTGDIIRVNTKTGEYIERVK